jgi:hypothetical protein
MCCFCHAQPFEITRAKNIKNTLWQHSRQNAKVVQAFCSRRVHHRDRHQHTIHIALAALPGAILPRLRALALFGRRRAEPADRLVIAGVQKPEQEQTWLLTRSLCRWLREGDCGTAFETLMQRGKAVKIGWRK